MSRMKVGHLRQTAAADKRAAVRFLKAQIRRSEVRLRLNKQNAAMHKYNIKWNNRLSAFSNIAYAVAETALVTALTAGSGAWFGARFVRWAKVRAGGQLALGAARSITQGAEMLGGVMGVVLVQGGVHLAKGQLLTTKGGIAAIATRLLALPFGKYGELARILWSVVWVSNAAINKAIDEAMAKARKNCAAHVQDFAKKEGAKLNWFSKLWGNDKALEADIIAHAKYMLEVQFVERLLRGQRALLKGVEAIDAATIYARNRRLKRRAVGRRRGVCI